MSEHMGMYVYNDEKRMIVPNESWRQMFVDNGAGEDREKGGSTSSSATWRTCGSIWWTLRIERSGDGEPVWLISHPRDPQPGNERRAWR